MRNWKELKDGSLNIPPELREHLLKFSERTIPPLDKKSIKIDIATPEIIGEFQAIIDKCARKDQSHVNSDQEQNKKEDQESKKTRLKYDNKTLTLEELTNKIKMRMDKGKDIDVTDQIMLNTVNESKVQEHTEINNEIEMHKGENELTSSVKENETAIQIRTYPERIRIPKKAYKKGATYKVDDCYYDHDGRFLYRVIGISN